MRITKWLLTVDMPRATATASVNVLTRDTTAYLQNKHICKTNISGEQIYSSCQREQTFTKRRTWSIDFNTINLPRYGWNITNMMECFLWIDNHLYFGGKKWKKRLLVVEYFSRSVHSLAPLTKLWLLLDSLENDMIWLWILDKGPFL